MTQIDDGFGDAELPKRTPTKIDLPEWPVDVLTGSDGAFVQPTGSNADRLEEATTWRKPIFNGPVASTEDVAHWGPADTRRNLEELTLRLTRAGWRKHPTVIDRWTSPNGWAVEMGYVHGEVWVRALADLARGEYARKPLWVQRIRGWQTQISAGTQEAIFVDLMRLAGGQGPAQADGTSGAAPEAGRGLSLGFVLLTSGAKMPTRAYSSDAGFDLYVAADTQIEPGGFADIPLGVSVGLPPGVWGRITGRSSTLRKFRLLVNEGIIDSGYTGPLFAGCQNLGLDPIRVDEGWRIAQLILHTNTTANYEPVEVAGHDETERGVKGFGSSGD